MAKTDLRYSPIEFPGGKLPAYEYIDFGLDGIGIQIEQSTGWRTFLENGLAYVYQQERAQRTGHDDWVANRMIELIHLTQQYKN